MSTRENNLEQKHRFYMRLAFNQARRLQGNRGKNPAVGCAIVKNDTLVNLSHTKFNGRPHAEQIALTIKKNFKNNSLYSTLEPCNHYGKTGPCTNIIIKKSLKSVYYSKIDPDKRSANKTKSILLKKGIKVLVGLCLKEGVNFYKDFHIKHRTKKIFITSKLATSKDYFISKKNNKWITNYYSRGRVHLLRANHDAILTTSKTVIKDNPSLDCRISGLEKFSPARFILDKNLKISTKSKIFSSSNKIKTYLFYNHINVSKLKKLKRLKINTVRIDLKNKQLDFEKIIFFIRSRGFFRLFVEAGIIFNDYLLKNNYINEFYHFYSSDLFRKKGLNSGRFLFKKIIKTKKNKKEVIVNLFQDKLVKYLLK